ncbi:cell separation during budding [Saxophila tyrrhenica]|uniref:Cell separation during budding n=1 Tax=Saxophila tyrrhenica TaxID=1690608 RepID=A0AAV9PJN7_9PEZI|nr:cell separation during budding [Saxophila tyrrhenica]
MAAPQPTANGSSRSSLEEPTSPRHKPAALSSTAVSSTTTTPLQTPRKESSPSVSHRSSFAENLRAHPSSPRAQRHNSFSGAALTELLMNPPVKTNGEDAARFKGRDWRTVQVHEIIDPAETRFVELDSSIEETTKLLIKSGAPNVVLIRESRTTKTPIGWFGYDELNAYLLLVLGLTQPDESATQLRERARSGETLQLREVNDHLGLQDEPMMLPHTANLTQAMEMLGSGVHRIVVTKEGTSEALGILSQLRLVRFFWENHQNFAATERLYGVTLKELEIGAKDVLAINGDRPLSDALRLMNDESVSSLPVLDIHSNVVGNISHVDTRLLTDTSAIPLLSSSCIHFISVILSERGVQDGKDSYPVFHVSPYSTLAHTVAKLCATRSHRMWITDPSASPSGSIPPSPGVGPHTTVPPFSMQNSSAHTTAPAGRPDSARGSEPHVVSGPPFTNPNMGASAAHMPGANMSGRLSGVVSLTDVLNILARASGLSPGDPETTRRRRRRSSSSSRSRSFAEGARPSAEVIRGSMDSGRRSGSMGASGRR